MGINLRILKKYAYVVQTFNRKKNVIVMQVLAWPVRTMRILERVQAFLPLLTIQIFYFSS